MNFAIPAPNVSMLTAHLDRLNKRAIRLGMEPITYAVMDRFTRKDTNDVYQNIQIDGDTPVINGWGLVAAVEYLDTGADVVKSLDPEFVCPTKYRAIKPYCEHCNTHKVKRYTMILRNVESGEFKMVGKTCMKDFLGDDVEMVIRRYNWFMQVVNELSDPDSEYYGSGGEQYVAVDSVLNYAAEFTLKDGYKPVHFQDNSTKNIVMLTLTDPKLMFKPSESAVKFAADVKEWVMNSDDDNDFMLNVKNLMDVGYITLRMVGYIVGAVGSYNAFMQREAKAKADMDSILNEHFGEVKKRYTLELTLIKMTAIEGYYGTTWVHTFRDTDNRTFVWFGTKQLRTIDDESVELGESIKVKATVKEHGEFRGVKQTNVNRVTPVK